MNKLEKAKAMQCFGKVVEYVELDPDPTTKNMITKEYNCKHCESYKYCCKLADTLKGNK